MPPTNAQIAAMLDELADLLEVLAANPFRVRAYRNAARAIEGMPRSLSHMVEEGEDLRALPGIGEDLALKIEEIARTGDLEYLHKQRAKVPPGLVDLLQLPGLGPKRVKLLRETLGVQDLATLQAALDSGKVRELKGFSEKTEQRLRSGIERFSGRERRILRADAEEVATRLETRLRAVPGVGRLELAGSYRRRRETVGDLDILVTSADPRALMDAFVGLDEVHDVLANGASKSSVKLRSGLQVDLRIVPEESFGAALHYFTGSKTHNIAVRRMGQERGLKINEYGVFRVPRSGDDDKADPSAGALEEGAPAAQEERVGGRTEEEVFAAVGLPWIPPELREDRGEVQAALEGRLPELVRVEDLRGDLQSHTTETDGEDSLEAMARAALAFGHAYLAVTDHSKRVSVVRGMDAKRARAHAERISALHERLHQETEGRFSLLKGVEVDILKDGSLDLPDDVLARMDVVVCSVHYDRDLPQDEQMQRVLRAMENPHAHILGHPTGRILEERDPMPLDMERILDAARDQGWFVELDAQPKRLDLSDAHARMAKERGVLVAIDSDAHSTGQLKNLRHGVDQARRAWLEKDDVLNTRPLDELRRLLARRR